ncbi:MAG: haloacid dehalogenase-like hydrolase [Clostridia bacterium]|nr:haloacid dehalogenase-like hydrolase [Clostridia bacterium]
MYNEQMNTEEQKIDAVSAPKGQISDACAETNKISTGLEISEKEALHGVKLFTDEAVEVDMYDFDKTAIPFDSQLKYWGYCMLHNPWIILMLPLQFIWGVMMGLKIISVKTCKRVAFWFAIFINNKRNVEKFWDKYEKQIYDWFRPENRNGRKTVLISASPDFLIEEIARRMGVDYCIATTCNKKTYTMIGEICRREEKVVRLKKQLPNIIVKDVYSDSINSDKYIFNLGERCFLATKGELTEIEKPSLDEVVKKGKRKK